MGTSYTKTLEIDLEKLSQKRKLEFWLAPSYEQTYKNDSISSNMLTQRDYNLIVNTIKDFFNKEKVNKLNILEIGAGNCIVTYQIINKLIQQFNIHIVCTDLYDYPNAKLKVIGNMPSSLAVKKYLASTDVLLIIFPPCNFTDYYAIKEFEQKVGIGYLIYIGDMGGVDGCEGMFKYLEKSRYKLLAEEKIFQVVDSCGHKCDKNLFIYKLS